MSNKEATLISQLEKLLKFGSLKLSQLQIDTNTGLKLQVLFQMTGAVHNYAEAILILAKEGKVEAGEVLVRSLFEGFTTTIYILEDNTDIRAIRFFLDDEIEKENFADNWMKFIKKNPSYGEEIPEMSTLEKCEEFIRERQKNIQSIKKQYGKNLKRLPDLRCRAEKVGAASELNYLTIYWYLSGLAHLSATGLKIFLEQKDDSYLFNIGKNLLGLERLLKVTHIFYLRFLGQLSLYFDIPTEKELKPFEDAIKK